MMDILPNEDLLGGLAKKFSFKQQVYRNTAETFNCFKSIMKKMSDEFRTKYNTMEPEVPFEFNDISEFEAELKFGSDVLIFMMHSNVFEFSRDHEVMKTPYVRQDPNRSYCGMIMIFNFLADSFRYNRLNDLGYLIGRVFINNENHYFIEGKREIGLLYNSFQSAVMNPESARQIVDSAVRYTVNFDLLTPPYDNVKVVSVGDMMSAIDSTKIRTAKRLGFRFQGDHEEFGS
ncbi:MAG TPA: hypothetical protein PLJ84_07850 [Bacteroidales bacterium]|nr:hypothetical protein [Bacteroidales bacterium]HPT02498.1 hypothetical protein [Bacteroidales bacterium]